MEAKDLRVIWTGRREDVHDFLRASDIFVFPSREEGMPNALLEAMAAGLPCLVTRIAGIEEVVTPGLNGVLVPPADITALTTGLRQLLSMEAEGLREMGDNARMHVSKYYSVSTVARRYAELYRSLVGQTTFGG